MRDAEAPYEGTAVVYNLTLITWDFELAYHVQELEEEAIEPALVTAHYQGRARGDHVPERPYGGQTLGAFLY